MKLLIATDIYTAWFADLRDARAKAAINARLRHLELGSLGDCDLVGDEVLALKIDLPPGYRVFVAERNFGAILLLAGERKAA